MCGVTKKEKGRNGNIELGMRDCDCITEQKRIWNCFWMFALFFKLINFCKEKENSFEECAFSGFIIRVVNLFLWETTPTKPRKSLAYFTRFIIPFGK